MQGAPIGRIRRGSRRKDRDRPGGRDPRGHERQETWGDGLAGQGRLDPFFAQTAGLGDIIAAMLAVIPMADAPYMPTLPFDHSWSASHSMTSRPSSDDRRSNRSNCPPEHAVPRSDMCTAT